MNKSDVKLIENMIKRLDRMIKKERDEYILESLQNAAATLDGILWEV